MHCGKTPDNSFDKKAIMRSTQVKVITVRTKLFIMRRLHPLTIPPCWAGLPSSQRTAPQGNYFLLSTTSREQSVNLLLQLHKCTNQFLLLSFCTMNQTYCVSPEYTSNRKRQHSPLSSNTHSHAVLPPAHNHFHTQSE